MRLLLILIALMALAAVLGRLILVQRKKARRRAYFRNRDARVRQQWADLEAMDDPRRSS